MADKSTKRPCAIILTAIPVEYRAVRSYLSHVQEITHPRGTIYECGVFTSEKLTWDVGIIEIGAGDVGSALEAERAISYFQPKLMFFVGVAGGMKDVQLGDVVVATKVYYYESGKANETFETRPEIGIPSFPLRQRALVESRKSDWLQRLGNTMPESAPRVFLAPIAAGEKVIISRHSIVSELITQSYGDALAVEMEGYGFLRVAYANPVLALVIRGISDLIDDKAEADAANTQELAARHASAFAFEILAKYDPESNQEKTFEDFTRSQRDFKDFKDKVEGKWKNLSDESSDDKAQHNKINDSDERIRRNERISEKLKKERQNVTFFTGTESKVENTQLPKTEEEFAEWYYDLGDYEQYYVLTTAVLHGAPVREVVKHTDSFYRFIHDEVERRGNLLKPPSYFKGDQQEDQQIESTRFSDPLLRNVSGKDLRKITYTKTRRVADVECLYWQDADQYGLSTFGLHLLEFLCKEYIGKSELGQFFLNALRRWSEEGIEGVTGKENQSEEGIKEVTGKENQSEEDIDEVTKKAIHSFGVVLWCHDAKMLKKKAKEWALEDKPKSTAELLDGAYEIYRVKSDDELSDVEASPVVLALLKKWIKHIHKVLSTDEFEFQIGESKTKVDLKEAGKKEGEKQVDTKEVGREKDDNPADLKEVGKKEGERKDKAREDDLDEDEFSKEEFTPEVAIRLGCAVASTYALIGKRSPIIALGGLERLFKISLSNDEKKLKDTSRIFAYGLSTYVILSWSGHIRDVIQHLATSAEQLSHLRNLPRNSKKRYEYRRQKAIYLDVMLEAFFLVAAASSIDVQEIQDVEYSLREPLPSQPAIPDTAGRDVLLAFLLSESEVICQEYITRLLCAAIIERKSRYAFGLLRYWAEIVLHIRESQVYDAEETYSIYLQFIVYLGRTVEKWCFDLEQQKLLPPPAFETFKNRLKQWCTEGAFYSHPIGSLAREALEQLGD